MKKTMSRPCKRKVTTDIQNVINNILDFRLNTLKGRLSNKTSTNKVLVLYSL